MTHDARRLEAALKAVQRAGRVCDGIQGRLKKAGVLDKDDRSPVTVADFASQAVVCALLRKDLGEEVIVGEEGSEALRRQENEALLQAVVEAVAEEVSGEMGRVERSDVLSWIDWGGGQAEGEAFWTLDPIDGTKGFLRGDQYAVALGYIEKGRPTLGVLGCPNLPSEGGRGAVFTAVLGGGCRRHPALHAAAPDSPRDVAPVVSPPHVDPGEARFCESVEKAHTDQSLSVRIAKEAGLSPEPFRMDSQCKYAVVATGEASVYLRVPKKKGYFEKIWDHAAGALVVESAGGRVTDLDGKPLDFSKGGRLVDNRGVVASSGAVHQRVLQAIATLGI